MCVRLLFLQGVNVYMSNNGHFYKIFNGSLSDKSQYMCSQCIARNDKNYYVFFKNISRS